MLKNALEKYIGEYVFQLNNALSIIAVWPQTTKMLGYLTASLYKKQFTSFLTSESKEGFNKTISALIAKSAKATIKIDALLLTDKKEKWFSLSIKKIIDTGKTNFVIAIKDIHAYKLKQLKLERLLKEKQSASARLSGLNENILTNANAIIVTFDIQGRIHLYNKSTEKITGYKKEELQRDDWLELVMPKEKFPHVHEEFYHLLGGGKPNPIVTPIINKKKEIKYVSWNNTQLIVRNKVVGLICVGKDITELTISTQKLQESEKRFRMLAEFLPTPICCCSIDGKIVFLNKAFIDTYGYTQQDVSSVDAWIKAAFADKEERIRAKQRWYKRIDDLPSSTNIRSYHEIVCKSGQRKVIELTYAYHENYLYYAVVDVTDLKEKEDALLKSRSRFKHIAENMPIPIAGYDASLCLSFINKKFSEVLGYDIDEIRDYNTWINKFIFKEEGGRENFVDNWIAAVEAYKKEKGVTPFIIEAEILCKSGVIKCFEISMYVDDDIVMGTFVDITGRKKSEAVLIQSEERFRNIAENIPLPVCCFNGNMQIIYINKRFSKLTGYNLKEVSDVDDWRKYLIYESEETLIQARKEWEEAIKKGNLKGNSETHAFERTILCRDGRCRIFDVNFTVHDEYVYAILNEVTERKLTEKLLYESEQRFEALVENMPIAIGSHDLNGNITFVNEYFTQTVGYELSEIPTLHDWYKHTQPDEGIRIASIEAWEDVIDQYRKGNKENLPNIEMSVRCKKGNFKAFNFLFSVHGNNVYIILVDVTERRRTEKKLLASHQQLRDLTNHLQNIREEERKFIAREIHDELGQMVTGMKMDISMFKKKLNHPSPDMVERLTGIISFTDEIVKTIRRIASELRPSILDDIGLIATMEWQSRDFEKRTGIWCDFESNIADEIDLPVEKKSNIFRIYQESLTNIMRHAEATKVTTRFMRVYNKIILTIIDNGKGFNAHEDSNTLGLLGMKERAVMINGLFEISSKIGIGTTTRIIITLQ